MYVFVFLSGIGLYYSMSGKTGNNVLRFYQRRLRRLLMPYLLIAGSFYAAELLLIDWQPMEFFFRLSTLQFWFQKKGVWFVSMLIPLYIVYPFYYRWVESGHRFAKTAVTVLAIAAVSYAQYICSPDVYNRLMQVWNSYIVFAVGHYMGEYVKEGKVFPISVTAVTLLFYPVRAFIPVIKEIAFFGNLGYGLMGIALSVIGAKCLDILHWKQGNRMLRSLGKISFESYLTNHFLITLFVVYLRIKEVPLFRVKPYCAVEYLMIVILGLAVGYLHTKLEITGK